VTICSEIVGTELKLTAAGKLRHLREFSREQDPASADVAMAAVMATARVVGIQTLIWNPRSVDTNPNSSFADDQADVYAAVDGRCVITGRAQAGSFEGVLFYLPTIGNRGRIEAGMTGSHADLYGSNPDKHCWCDKEPPAARREHRGDCSLFLRSYCERTALCSGYRLESRT